MTETSASSPRTCVCVGAQWGDEGKGKIVDLLAAQADIVVRFQGGNNAGHTLVVDGVQTVLHLVPSGVLHPEATVVIGNGCVIDPEVLIQELDMLEARGLLGEPERLKVADNAHVILPFHKRIDRGRESERGKGKIGTTGRGIGPTYEDKAARRGTRMLDLVHPDRVSSAVRSGVVHANSLLEALGEEIYSGHELEEMIERMRRHGDRLRPFVCDAGVFLDERLKAGDRVLFEGAQGAMLDVDHGTYPYVTSSNTLAGEAAVGSGLGPRALQHVLGVSKAYTTRVGEGPFPTEETGDIGERIREAGHEFGATTGRKRRCGWIDLVQLRTALRLNSVTHLALTKLDVLAGFDRPRLCVAYEKDGERFDHVPHDGELLAGLTPVYDEMPGFESMPDKLESIDDLPPDAAAYIQRIVEELDVPLAILSYGPGRDEVLILDDVF